VSQCWRLKKKQALGAVLAQAETRVWGLPPGSGNGIGGCWPVTSTHVWGCWHIYAGTASDGLVNRYYSNAYGRFMTPDPYKGRSGGPGDPNNPQSWNRYAYVLGDPVNWVDPAGLDNCAPGDILPCAIVVTSGNTPGAGPGGGGGPSNQTAQEKGQHATPNPSGYTESLASFTQGLNLFLKSAESTACKGLPNGLVMSLSAMGAAGFGGTGSGEAVFNFNTGQISVFGSLGFTSGYAFPGASLQTGFIWGLGQSNNSYSGPFTSVSVGAGVIGGALATSSNGLQNPFNLSAPLVASIGAQTPGVTFAYGVSYYSNAVNVGNLNNLAYELLFPEIYQYMQGYQSLCGNSK